MGKYYIILGASIIVFFTAGFFTAGLINDSGAESCPPASSSPAKDSFAAGWEAARERLKETGYYFGDVNFPVKEVWGEIKQVNGNQVTVSIKPLDPLADKSLDERTVKVNGQTEIIKKEKKSQTEYENEVAAYRQDNAELLDGPVLPASYPNLFTERIIGLNELGPGQQVKVLANENIRDIKEFTATAIVVQFPEN